MAHQSRFSRVVSLAALGLSLFAAIEAYSNQQQLEELREEELNQVFTQHIWPCDIDYPVRLSSKLSFHSDLNSRTRQMSFAGEVIATHIDGVGTVFPNQLPPGVTLLSDNEPTSFVVDDKYFITMRC